MAASASARSGAPAASVKVGLITKDATNPFFVKMRAGATSAAKKLGASLVYAAGKSSSDNAAQIAAIENMTTAGVKGILITVADGKAENAAIAKARKAGVMVIALDTPTVPKSATNALFATNNFNAGVLIGKYARAATQGKTVTIAMLDERKSDCGNASIKVLARTMRSNSSEFSINVSSRRSSPARQGTTTASLCNQPNVLLLSATR